MKKTLLVAFAVFFAMSVKAQLWIGGEVGYYYAKPNKAFTCSPELFYDLNKTWSIGMSFGYQHTNYTTSSKRWNLLDDGQGRYRELYVTTDKKKTTMWEIAPFVRCKFAKVGNLGLFVDAALAYNISHVYDFLTEGYCYLNISDDSFYYDDSSKNIKVNYTKADYKIYGYGAFVSPGLSYKISDGVSFEAHLGNLSFVRAKNELLDEKNWSTIVDLKMKSEFTMGVYFRL